MYASIHQWIPYSLFVNKKQDEKGVFLHRPLNQPMGFLDQFVCRSGSEWVEVDSVAMVADPTVQVVDLQYLARIQYPVA